MQTVCFGGSKPPPYDYGYGLQMGEQAPPYGASAGGLYSLIAAHLHEGEWDGYEQSEISCCYKSRLRRRG